MQRLLLADRVKSERDSFLAPLMPALARHYDLRFISVGPGADLKAAIDWADIVWLEWCWDHAVWATSSGVLGGRPCVVRLHSIEALQTDFPARVNWSAVDLLIAPGADIAEITRQRFPALASSVPIQIVPNGIDTARFVPRFHENITPDRFRIGWVGHVEPKKNPMLLLQIAHRLHQMDARYTLHAAGTLTDLRTLRYVQRLLPRLGLQTVLHFEGPVADMPAWYSDKGVLLSTTLYESFGLNIGEAMAVGAFPVVHDFPGADLLWPEECLFASIDEAVALIRSARTGLYRDWIEARYSLTRQTETVLRLLRTVAAPIRCSRAAG